MALPLPPPREEVDPHQTTFVVDEHRLVDERTISDGQVHMLLLAAIASGERELRAACRTALEAQANSLPWWRSRRVVAARWNDEMTRVLASQDRRSQDEVQDRPRGRQTVSYSPAYDTAQGRDVAPIVPQGWPRDGAPDVPGADDGADDLDPGATQVSASVLAVVPVACPLCHAQVTPRTDGQGRIVLPDHPIVTPVFPHGLGGPPFLVQCPLGSATAVQVCTWGHRPPACDDPSCPYQGSGGET